MIARRCSLAVLLFARDEYDLNYIGSTKGDKVGTNKVMVSWVDYGGGAPAKKVKIPAKYSTDSELSVDVNPGSNSFDFDLKSR